MSKQPIVISLTNAVQGRAIFVQIREALGLTQQQIADACKMHPQAVSRLEQPGQVPTLKVLARLAEVPGVKAISIHVEFE